MRRNSQIYIQRQESSRYVNEDEPTMLRFNPSDDEDNNAESGSKEKNDFIYNYEEDMYKLSPRKSGNKIGKKTSLPTIIEETVQNSRKNDSNNNNSDEISPSRSNIIFANVKNVNFKEKMLYPLYIIVLSYLIFTILEIICGYYSKSITLMADAAHFFSECFCYIIYIVSIYVTKKGTTNDMSFGFHRGEIIGVLFSSTFLWGFSIWLIYSAGYRYYFPEEVSGIIVIFVGIGSTLANLIMGLILMFMGIGNEISFDESEKICDKSHHNHSANELSCDTIKVSFTHVVVKAILSCIIVLAGIFIYFLPSMSYIDTITTIFLTIILLYNSYLHLEGSITILMEGSPLEFDIEELENDLLGIKGVIDVHDIHVWSLSIGKISMSCHLTTSDPQTSLKLARSLIKKKYNITHTTIQVELDTEKLNVCKGNLH